MILWITGNSGSGKSTLAKQMKTPNTVILDGDDLRCVYPTGFSKQDRWHHNKRIAYLAKLMEKQGFDVIVSVIAPYKELRDEIQEWINCSYIYLTGGEKTDKEYPYEYEEDKFYFKKNEKTIKRKRS